MTKTINQIRNQDPSDFSLPEITEQSIVEALGRLRDCVQFSPDPAWDEDELERNILYVSGDLLLDVYNCRVYRKGVVMGTLSREAMMIIYLAERCNTVVSRDELLDNYDFGKLYALPEAASKMIYGLRTKLRKCTLSGHEERPYIVTMHKVGYKWNFPLVRLYRIPGRL